MRRCLTVQRGKPMFSGFALCRRISMCGFRALRGSLALLSIEPLRGSRSV
jgi:hypothetical protein